MSSLLLSASLICSLIPIHGITACQLAPRKLSATDVSTPADPSPSPHRCTHMALEDCPPEQRNGGFLWRTGNQTFLAQWREWPAGSISTHFTLYSTIRLWWKTKLELHTQAGEFGVVHSGLTF